MQGSKNVNVTISNRSRQMIPLQIRPPKGDFFYEEHQVRINPGATAQVPKRYLNWAQIENCKGRGDISVVEEK